MLDRREKPLFSEGQSVYYPGSGVATIVAIEDMEVAGFLTTVYDLHYARDGSHVMVPLSKAAKNGLRNIGTMEQLHAAVAIIKDRSRASKKMWQLWAKQLEEKLQSTDLRVVAEVIRDLYVPEGSETDRSDTERRIYEQAFRLFLPEAALILSKSEQDTLAYLTAQTGKMFKPSLAANRRESVTVGPAKYRTPTTPRAPAPKPSRPATPAAPKLAAVPIAVRPPPPPPVRPVAPPSVPAKPAPPQLVVDNRPRTPSVPPAGNGRDVHAEELAATVAELRRSLVSVRTEAMNMHKQLEAAQKSHRADTEALQKHLAARTLEAKALEEQLSVASRELRDAQEQLRGANEKLKAQGSRIGNLETVHRNEIGRLQELLLFACLAFCACESERSRLTQATATKEAPVAAKPQPKKRSSLKRQPGGFLWDPKWDVEIERKKKR